MRTVIWFTNFVCAVIAAFPKLRTAKRIEKNEGIEARDAYVTKVSKAWMRDRIKCSGSTVTVRGAENLPKEGPVVFMCNHQGNFDIPILMGHIDLPFGFISKAEVKKMPVIRDWMELLYCTFMDRDDPRAAVRSITEGINNLKAGHSLVIFPEGTRSKGGPLGEFKAGSFKLATKSGVPIVPVTINGSYKIMEANNNRIKPAEVELVIHPAMPTAGLNKDELATLPAAIKAMVASGLK